jgi:hypothetical protein
MLIILHILVEKSLEQDASNLYLIMLDLQSISKLCLRINSSKKLYIFELHPTSASTVRNERLWNDYYKLNLWRISFSLLDLVAENPNMVILAASILFCYLWTV